MTGRVVAAQAAQPDVPALQLDARPHAQSVPAHKAAERTDLHPVFAMRCHKQLEKLPPFAATPDTKTDSTMPPGGQ
jgi:hypothetical protein